MKPQTPTILQAIKDEKLFGRSFRPKLLRGDTYRNWRAALCGVFGLPFETAEAFEIFKRCTGRTKAAITAFKEIFLVIGRRGGKSFVCALIALYVACFVDFSPYLAAGEVATVAIIAADKKQAAILLRYIRGFLASSDILRAMVVSDLKETITLKNGIVVEVMTADFRSVRGRTFAAVLVDELAFLPSGDSASPDAELLGALRPGLISMPNSLLIGLSSPYSQSGVLYQQFKEHYGRDDSDVLVWKADSQTMNPTLSSAAIKLAYLRDPVAAATEYGAEWRSDLANFLSLEAVEACVVADRNRLPALADLSYRAFVDASGGRSDSFTMAVGHSGKEKVVLDLVVEYPAPFSPEQVVEELCAILRRYNVHEVSGDRYAAEWCAAAFEKNGVSYQASELNKSEIYLEFLPMATSGQVELLDHRKLVNQLASLERRTSRGGRDSIDHRVGSHDDLANAAAGVLALLAGQSHVFGLLDYYSGIDSGAEPMPEPLPQPARALPVPVKPAQETRSVPAPSPPSPPCPVCRSTLTQRLGGPDWFHSNCCGVDFSLNGEIKIPSDAPCCADYLPQVVGGGGVRCGSCGKQRVLEPTPRGVSRADVLAGRIRGRNA
jgi:hypothetical protein